jgi:hypothetical protein
LQLQLNGHVPDVSEGSVPGLFFFRKRAHRGMSHHIWGTFVDNLGCLVGTTGQGLGSW